ncbi:MAG: hypothetical protein IH586_17430, partial [Anaerolineaceae bacterium]|nr:hypothetical protein [Anaerolineaceae bacterium]
LPARLTPVPVETLRVAGREFVLPFAPLPTREAVLETIARNERILAGDSTSPDLQPLITEYSAWRAATDPDLPGAILHWASVFREAAQRTLHAVEAPHPPAGAPFRIAGLVMGRFSFVFLSGEILTPVGRHIQALAPQRKVKVISYLSPIAGYIASADDFSLGGYELDNAWMWYRMPGPFRHDIEDTILPQVKLLLEKLS